MFRMDIAKVDRDVVYGSIVVHLRWKGLFPMFHLFFQTYVASVFIWMLLIFHTYVASVLSRCCVCVAIVFQVFHVFFVSVSDAYFKHFICVQTYVASVVSRCFKSRSDVASPSLPSVASP